MADRRRTLATRPRAQRQPVPDPTGDRRAAFLAALEHGVSPVVPGPVLQQPKRREVYAGR